MFEETEKRRLFVEDNVILEFNELDHLKINSETMKEATEDDSIDSGEVDKLIRKSIPNDLRKVVKNIQSERKRRTKETFRLPKSTTSAENRTRCTGIREK